MSSLDLAQLIRERAYQRWEAREGAEGNPDDDWLEAEREVKASDASVESELTKDVEHEAETLERGT